MQQQGGGTTIAILDIGTVKRTPLALPSLDEQRAIADFLDAMDERITRFIEAQRRMIALLEEQKQAIINQAVTRGLDSDVPMKPSGVDWLGDIPAHWEVTKLGRVINLLTGFPFKSDGFSQSDSDMKLLRGINIVPGGIRWESVVHWPQEQLREFEGYSLHCGDIVLGMDRPIISTGVRVARIESDDVPSLLLQRVARIRPRRQVSGEHVMRLLNSSGFREYLEPIFTGISVPHLSPEQIRGFPIAIPPIGEQAAISAHIDQVSAQVDATTHRQLREIDLIQEYRTRLISDVVTGKLDVRGAGLNLRQTGM